MSGLRGRRGGSPGFSGTSGGSAVLHATRNNHRLRSVIVLGSSGLLSATALMATAAPTVASAQEAARMTGACVTHTAARIGHIGGIVHARSTRASCAATPRPGDLAIGTPPLLYHGGAVMGTASTGPVVITPIFWNPTGHPMAAIYKTIVSQYLLDVMAASLTPTNVFSTLPEYGGSNGTIRYAIVRTPVLSDPRPLPASGCTVAPADATGIYSDGTGYDWCLSDAQLQAEIDSVINAFGLKRDNGHLYVIFLPKHVESCYLPGSTTTSLNSCTLNHQPSAAYCAYHSKGTSGTIYANLPYPAYHSNTGYTCSSDKNYGTVESPNNNPDADTEVSPTSHEISEAITDPDVSTGWYDSTGYENGDECAYVYGATVGNAGALYNQTINGHHFLTQEEFSNQDWSLTGGGCLQHH